ncbi:MAG: DUF4162 domain-containing protein, partial [Chitinophagales bacterium]
IVLINKGKLVITGTVADIKNTYRENIFEIACTTLPDMESNDLFDVIARNGNAIRLHVKNTNTNNAILQYFINRNLEVTFYHEILPSLNEVFIKLVKTSDIA